MILWLLTSSFVVYQLVSCAKRRLEAETKKKQQPPSVNLKTTKEDEETATPEPRRLENSSPVIVLPSAGQMGVKTMRSQLSRKKKSLQGAEDERRVTFRLTSTSPQTASPQQKSHVSSRRKIN